MSKLYNIKNHPHYAKALHWGKLISVTGSAQMIVQAVGFVSGILVIRMLPVEEYAIYTLANTMLGTMTVLSDGGISTGVMAQGGKVWQDREKLGAVLATGLDLRRKFAIGSLIISIPILAYLLHTHGVSWLTIALITVSLIPAFFAALSDTLLQVPAKLHQAILPLQRNQVEVGIGRLVLTGISIFAFPWAFVAVLASGIPRMYGNIKLRKIANVFVDKSQEPNLEDRKNVLKIVKRLYPSSLYYAFSGQITIWLISVFGNTYSVAELGALTRIVVLFTMFEILINTLFIPRFAILTQKKYLMRCFFFVISFVLILALLLLIFTYLLSDPILWLLGNNYKNLNLALLLKVTGSCIGLFSRAVYAMSTSKGWVINPMISIPINLLAIIVGILLFNLSTLEGVLVYSIYLLIIEVFVNLSFFFFRIKNYNQQVVG
ncbi:polysaccharide biosynthesis protein [Dysgonomonas sp. BGC7]|uniref:polysaccharide biosynthesis protein n=1 Tax=Dysgonomonas sp. BGC7 TaxID=1658008 RepID=UPI000680DDC5|nr:polysaccharide biosynthesis protein [Dysgonomonas sp. BGC7]